jgi:hypothetical protein
MKNFISLMLLVTLTYMGFSQTNNGNYKVVPIVTSHDFYLNGGARAAFGGKSRVYLMVTLPPNTVEWYYAVTTTPGKGQGPQIGLAGQLAKLLVPGGGLASIVLSSLIAPTGSGVCDVYVFSDQGNLNRFIEKTENYTSLASAMRENFRHGVVQVRDAVQGSYFLGLRNPSGMSGINVTVEVTAIVKEPSASNSTN